MARIPASLMVVTALMLPFSTFAADEPKVGKPSPAVKVAKDERQCSMPTSPRLQKKGDDCAEAKEWTRSYSNEELNSTGQASAEALRKLDPRLR
jgi:hypothetical protein